jgi:hypothetical protein
MQHPDDRVQLPAKRGIGNLAPIWALGEFEVAGNPTFREYGLINGHKSIHKD